MSDHDETPHALPAHPMRKVCGAKTRKGTPCQSAPMANSRRCRMHGGSSLKGIASPSFRTGRFSKYLPGGYRAAYEAAINDPELLNLSDALAVLYARFHELMQGLGEDVPGRKLGAEWRRFKHAQTRRDRAGMLASADRLDALIEGAVGRSAQWDEIQQVLTQISAITAQEQKRRVEMSGLIRTERVAEFAREVLMAVRSEVTDPQVWARVQDRLTVIIGAPQYSAVVQADNAAADRADC